MNLILKLILPIFLCFLSGAGNTKSLIDKAQDGHPHSQFELALKEAFLLYISDMGLLAACKINQPLEEIF